MKKAEKDMTGGDQISEGAEMAGWGVEEAEQRNKSEASMLPLLFFFLSFYTLPLDINH